MTSPLDLLRSKPRPLSVHLVATPELVPDGELSEAEIARFEKQFLAELSGEEMDQFNDLWSVIREKFVDEESILRDYRRCAIAFSWCDENRNRFHSTANDVWEVVKLLRMRPDTLTSRMFQVANGANAFAGLDDETKKKSMVQAQDLKNSDGKSAPPTTSDSPAVGRGSQRSPRKTTPSSDTSTN